MFLFFLLLSILSYHNIVHLGSVYLDKIKSGRQKKSVYLQLRDFIVRLFASGASPSEIVAK